MDVKFLGPNFINGAVEKLFQNAKKARLAVAYWGLSAVDFLKLRKFGTDLKIVMHLLSGCVDPEVVELLEHAKIRNHNRLHTKIFWTDCGAIIGSCNASANGLCLADREMEGLKEAAVFVGPGTQAWSNARKTVEALFDEGDLITDAMLKQANDLRKKRRSSRPEPVGRKITLLHALLHKPEQLIDQNVRILIDRCAEWSGPSADEIEAGGAIGITPDRIDVWPGRMPKPMMAMCVTRKAHKARPASYKFNYVSEILDYSAAHIGEGSGQRTIGLFHDSSKMLEGKLGVSLSNATMATTMAGFSQICDFLWKNMDEDWNEYRNWTQKHARDFPRVLVRLDDVVRLLPRMKLRQ